MVQSGNSLTWSKKKKTVSEIKNEFNKTKQIQRQNSAIMYIINNKQCGNTKLTVQLQNKKF